MICLYALMRYKILAILYVVCTVVIVSANFADIRDSIEETVIADNENLEGNFMEKNKCQKPD